jgi:hypothetical protein
MSITIAEIQYLYPRLDFESGLNKTDLKLQKENKVS